MDTIGYATFRYDTVEVENGLHKHGLSEQCNEPFLSIEYEK